MGMSDLHLIGNEGEHLADTLLKEKGYKIIERNWKNRFGEIDLIASSKDTIVFIEVKARSSVRFGEALEAITPWKKRRLGRLAEMYMQKKKIQNKFIRFDVVTITWRSQNEPPEIEHLENVLFFDR